MNNPFESIEARLMHIENLILALKKENQKQALDPSDEDIVSIDTASKLLNLKKPTIYSKVNRGELPYFKKGKHLRFSKKALIDYIHSGRVKTTDELIDSASDYLAPMKGGK